MKFTFLGGVTFEINKMKQTFLSLDTVRKVSRGVLSPKSFVDVPAGPRKFDFSYTNFSPDYPPTSIPFSIEKQPVLFKLGAFYKKKTAQNTPNLCNLGSFVSDVNPPIVISKGTPKRQAHVRIPCQCEDPLGKAFCFRDILPVFNHHVNVIYLIFYYMVSVINMINGLRCIFTKQNK